MAAMTKRNEVLRIAAAELGYTETPAGSNRTKFGDWYGLDGQPWCMMFVQWVFWQAGASTLLPAKTASCSALMRAGQALGQWVTAEYRPGDVVIYDFSGRKERAEHCGIVETVHEGSVTAMEGNTGVGNDANGGAVMRRRRSSAVILGAIRPQYREEEQKVVYQYLRDVPEPFRVVVEVLMNAGVIRGDGSDKSGNADVINLTHEQVRTLVFVYRGGGFDKKLQAAGLKPAVEP